MTSLTEGRYLTAQEIATELGQRLYSVRRALAALSNVIPWKEQETGKRGLPAKLYHESGLDAIGREIERLRRRSAKKEQVDPYWRAQAALRLLRRDANDLADVASGIYELLRKNPPSESVIIHALPHPELSLQVPATVRLTVVRGHLWRATLADLPIEGSGRSQPMAIKAFLKRLVAAYLKAEQDPAADPDGWRLLQQLVRRLQLVPIPKQADFSSPALAQEAGLDFPTFMEWVEENTPQDRSSVAVAWRYGASACLHGRTRCQYRKPAFVEAWKEGFGAMSRHLEAGGRIACSSCMQPLPAGDPASDPGSSALLEESRP